MRANGPLVGSSTKVSVGRGRKDPRGTTTFRHLKGMIYYEKIKASTRTPEDLLFAIQNVGAPKREFAPGPRNTIGGLLTYLNENRLIFNISHFHLLLFCCCFFFFFWGGGQNGTLARFFICGGDCPPPPPSSVICAYGNYCVSEVYSTSKNKFLPSTHTL